MQDLHSLLHSLSCSEWAAFQNYLGVFTAHDTSKLKYLQLSRLLMASEKAPTHNACCVSIYSTKNEHSFDELKSSLKEKVMDFLLTDISSDKQKELDEADYAIIKMKKKSAQFQQLYYSKRRIPMLYDLLDEIITGAKEYEQYFILVEHLKAKKNIVSHKISNEEFEKINKEMEYSTMCSNIYNKAEHSYYQLTMFNAYFGKPDKQKILKDLQKNIAEVRAGFDLTNSPMIHYYLKNLEMGYFQLQEDYLKARSVCLELLNIVRNNKSVYRKQRLGAVYDNLSQCEFYLGNFIQAGDCAREAQKLFNQNSENYCIALEQEFYSLFAMKEYDGSIEIANKMISSATPKEMGQFRFSKYNYLLANALFKQDRFQEALQLLSQGREISKDKAGWETGARILKIMTLIEMLKLDEASLAVKSLKQFFKYTDKKTPVSIRDKKILNLLLVAENKGFMFSSLNGNTDKYMNALTSADKELRWEPFTHEVIPFHEWFAGKMKKHILPVSPAKELTPVKEKKEKVVSRTR
jgi:tetratricopeptide (TPR) repeat protein